MWADDDDDQASNMNDAEEEEHAYSPWAATAAAARMQRRDDSAATAAASSPAAAVASGLDYHHQFNLQQQKQQQLHQQYFDDSVYAGQMADQDATNQKHRLKNTIVMADGDDDDVLDLTTGATLQAYRDSLKNANPSLNLPSSSSSSGFADVVKPVSHKQWWSASAAASSQVCTALGGASQKILMNNLFARTVNK